MATTSERVTGTRRADPVAVRAFSLSVLALFLTLTSLSHFVASAEGASISTLASWALVAAVADTLRVRLWRDFSFAMSLPVTLAAGMVLAPTDAAIVAFVGAFDLRDFSGVIPIERVLGNRAIAGISILAGSSAFHAVGIDLSDWPLVLVASVVAYAVDFAVNVALVTFPVARLQGVGPGRVLVRLVEPTPSQAVMIYACVGLLAPIIALVSTSVGVFGVAVLLLPLGLARDAYRQTLRLNEMALRLHAKNRALRTVRQEAAEGRREERMVLWGELREDVLPSIAKVHHMGQVVRQDLAHGRLLQLEEDVPVLLAATNAAHSTVKGVMQGLEVSPLGIGGLTSALRVLVDHLESTSAHARIQLEVEEVSGTETALQTAFEVAREALQNSVSHANASHIELRLTVADDRIRLVIQDDGVGFRPQAAYMRGRSGLVRIRETVESVGGDVALASTPGKGSIVAATIPVDA